MNQNYRKNKLVLLCVGILAVLLFSACVPMGHGMGHEGGMRGEHARGHDGEMKKASKMHGDMMRPPTVTIASERFFPESVAVHHGTAYVSAFFSGEIQKIDMMSGEAEMLVEAGNDGVVMGWGLWYDNENDLLIACANRNQMGPQENNNAARAIDPDSGEILETWELPVRAMCNSIFTDGDGNVYLSDVSTGASIVKIDRSTGEAVTWLDEPSWENDSGFGVGGLIWDGSDSLYASAGGPLFRVPINEDGTAGEPIMQTILDADGNELPALGFDGFAFAGDNTMIGAAFDFEAFQSQVVKAVAIGDETVQTEVIFTDAIGITGIDVEHDHIFAVDGQIIQALFVEEYEAAPFLIQTINMHGEMNAMKSAMADDEGGSYNGPVTEIAIRRLNDGQDVDEFAAARDAFVAQLKQQPGVSSDREFAPFVDFLTFGPPEPPVFIGMTEYESLADFEAAGGALSDGAEAGAFFSTFTPEVFTVLRPLNPEDGYDLAAFATESGQVLEVAARDLSSYENFDMVDYETKRDAFLEALSQQPGWVAEMQWVSLFDPNLVVGMTVYESAEAYQAIYSSEFGQSQIAQDFGGGYPLVAGYASLDARAE
ncbi:MAG: hypothetical protein AAF702_48435 [Chloroflexota bacterium]